jgi:hypothetical protein
MAASGVETGGGVVEVTGEVTGEDEGVASGVEGGDAVVGERGGWCSRGVDRRAGVNEQRGSAGNVSAGSITIAHST